MSIIQQNKITVIIVGLFLTMIVFNKTQAQSDYPDLLKYRKWSFVLGPVLYNKASITRWYGEYELKNRPIPGFNAGFGYDFHPDKEWSFTTGFLVSLEPMYWYKFIIKSGDIYPQYSNYNVSNLGYSIVSFSAPLLINLKKRIAQNKYAKFFTGLKIMFYPSGSFESSIVFSDQELNESREVFGLRGETPDNMFYGNFMIGTGVELASEKFLWEAKLIYNINFQNPIVGEYQFGNLFVSEPTRGDYELSGNYIGLLFSLHLKKGKNNVYFL